MKTFLANILSLTAIGGYSQSIATKVTLADGIPEARAETSGVMSFKGIPFAASPTGELRWKAPQPFYMWSEEFLIPSQPISEDCLFPLGDEVVEGTIPDKENLDFLQATLSPKHE